MKSQGRAVCQRFNETMSAGRLAGTLGMSKSGLIGRFGDKESLFAAAVKSHCEQQLPSSLFEPMPEVAKFCGSLASICRMPPII